MPTRNALCLRFSVFCLLALSCVAAALGPLAGAARAATYQVTTLADGGVGSLRAAITSANASAGSIITFKPVLSGTILLASALPALGKSMTIQGPGTSVLAVDGQHAARPFLINSGVTARLSGLTIQNGNGGGVANSGTLTLTNCTLTGNSTSYGGGVYNSGTLTLTGCTLAGNSAYLGGGVYNDGTATLNTCTLTGDIGADSGGGVFNGGTLTLTGCTLTGNDAKSESGGEFTGGGGVYNNHTATTTLTGCTFAANDALNAGGGVYNYNYSTVTLTGCTLAGNSASDGGGILSNGTLTLTGCTLTGNSAGYGGGVFNTRTATLTDDILYGDSASDSAELYGSFSAAYCDIGQDGYAGSSGNLNADPRLSALGSYGGPTQTCALLPGSACLGAGTNAGPAADQRGVPVPQGGRYDIGAFESRGFIITVTGGSGQSAPVGAAFAKSLTATVAADFTVEPVAGGVLIFTGPAGGASAAFSPDPATIDGTGVAAVTATANGVIGGPYTVTARAGSLIATYSLTNGAASTAPIITTQPTRQTVTAGQTATFTAAALGDPLPTVQWQVSTNGGSLFINITGATSTTYRFTATAGLSGDLYRAVFTNSIGLVATSAATLTVIAPPTANAQAVAVAFNTAKAIILTGSDPNSPPLSLTYAVTSGPSHGTLTGAAPNLAYTPAAGYSGPDGFTFTASNGTYTSAPATVTITVAAGTPTAHAQSVSVPFNTATVITLTGTDPDVPALTLTYAVFVGPFKGTLTGTAPHLTYTPNAGYYGPDRVTFQVSNGFNFSVASVTIDVSAGTPTANAQSAAVPFDTATAITLTGSDSNSPPQTLIYSAATNPAHGTLTGTAPNLTYTPAVGYSGPDSFTFTVSNGANTSSAATVTLNVATGTPTANAQSVSTNQDSAVGVTLTGTDPDVPALPLTYSVAAGPAHGALTGTGPNLTYTPAAGYSGPDGFTFTAGNGTSTSTPATVSITVTQAVLVAADVTAQVTVTLGGFRFVRATGHYLQPVTLLNAGAALPDPVSLALDGLTGATLVGASGTTALALPAGSPFVALPTGGLAAGASVTVTLEFAAQPSGYSIRVLAGPGAR